MLRRRLLIIVAVMAGMALVLLLQARCPRGTEKEAFTSGAANLAVGAKFSLPEEQPPTVIKSYDFNRSGDSEGWELQLPEETDKLWVADGTLHIRRETAIQAKLCNEIAINPAAVNLIELRVREPISRFSVAWRIGPSKWNPDFSGSRAISAEEWRTVSIPVGRSSYWGGKITALMVHLLVPESAAENEFQIDSIRLLRDENPSFIKRPRRLGYAIADECQWVIPTAVGEVFEKEVEIPQHARLRFSCGLSKETWLAHSSEVVLQVSAATEGEKSQALASVTLKPKALRGKWKWANEMVDLKELAGRRVRLTFQSNSADEKSSGLVLWGNPTIEPARARPSRERPNIIVFLVDALRPDHLSTYGYEKPTSPNLEELAKDAIVFENAFAQAHNTHVSVASLFTSLFPLEAKDEATGYFNLKEDVTTLSERLQAAGYMNVAFSTNYFIHWDYGFDRGFDAFHCQHELASKLLTKKVLNWLESNTQRPFFLYVHLMDTHSPYAPPKEFRAKFVPSDYHPTHSALLSGSPGVMKKEMEAGREFGPQDWEYLISLYDGTIAAADWNIGRIIRWLRDKKIYDDTIIVVLADHGEEFWEHGGLEHGNALYDELLRVPLILKVPKKMRRRGERVADTVQLVDVYPTLLELAGVPAVAGIRGENLLNIEPGDTRWAYAEIPTMRALRGEGWKLIDKSGSHTDELYNIRQDPLEQENIIQVYPEIAAKLRAEMDQLSQTRELYSNEDEEREKIDPKTLERLRSLGYIE